MINKLFTSVITSRIVRKKQQSRDLVVYRKSILLLIISISSDYRKFTEHNTPLCLGGTTIVITRNNWNKNKGSRKLNLYIC